MLDAALHVHSDWSYDGRWSLEKISRVFGERGYGAVLLCEHCRTFDPERWSRYVDACRSTRPGARLIPGIEYSDPTNTIHIPVWGLSSFVAPEPETRRLIEFLDDCEDRFAVFAHPARRDAWRVVSGELLDRLDAVEVWNRKTDGLCPGDKSSEFVRRGLAPVVSLDFHSDRQRLPLVTKIDVDAEASDTEVIEALRAGRHRGQVLGHDVVSLQGSVIGSALSAIEIIRLTWRAVRPTPSGSRPSREGA